MNDIIILILNQIKCPKGSEMKILPNKCEVFHCNCHFVRLFMGYTHFTLLRVKYIYQYLKYSVSKR